MATTPTTFELDITGFSLANRKIREPYSLPVTDSFIRAISPVMGCFFTKSVYITDRIRNKDLKFGIDYIFTEIYSSLSTIFPQPYIVTCVIRPNESYSYCNCKSSQKGDSVPISVYAPIFFPYNPAMIF